MSIKKTTFDPNKIAPGDIIREKRVTNLDGTMTERSRWLVLERHLCQPEMEDIEWKGQPVFKCLLLSFNRRHWYAHWHLGLQKWLKPEKVELWDVVVESGLSWDNV